jgi:hypothetical protein
MDCTPLVSMVPICDTNRVLPVSSLILAAVKSNSNHRRVRRRTSQLCPDLELNQGHTQSHKQTKAECHCDRRIGNVSRSISLSFIRFCKVMRARSEVWCGKMSWGNFPSFLVTCDNTWFLCVILDYWMLWGKIVGID